MAKKNPRKNAFTVRSGQRKINLSINGEPQSDLTTCFVDDAQSVSSESDPSLDLLKKDEAWLESVTHSVSAFFLKVTMGLYFIFDNIQVNTYSIRRNIEKPPYVDVKGVIDGPLVYGFGFFTFIANLVSKINILGNPAEGIFLDKHYAFLADQFFCHGSETQLYLNAKRAIETAGIFNDCDMLVYISPEVRCQYKTKKIEQIEHLLTSEFKGKIEFTHNLSISTKKNIVLISCDLSEENFKEFQSRCLRQKIYQIKFYPQHWLGRIYNDLRHLDLLAAAWAAIKANLALFRWVITKGVPGLVVVLTIFSAFVRNFEVIDLSITQRQWMFWVNLSVAWFGKVLINNKLKGEKADLELKKLLMRFQYWQFPHFNKQQKFFLILTVTLYLIAIFPNTIVTPFFFAESGTIAFMKELNLAVIAPLFNTTLTLSQGLLWNFTKWAVVTNVWLSVPTALMPTYKKMVDYAEKYQERKKEALAAKEPVVVAEESSPEKPKSAEEIAEAASIAKTLRWFEPLVIVSILFDSLVTGWNTSFSTDATIADVLEQPDTRGALIEAFASLLINYALLQTILPYVFGAGNFIFQAFWSLYTLGDEKTVENYLKVIPKLKGSIQESGFFCVKPKKSANDYRASPDSVCQA